MYSHLIREETTDDLQHSEDELLLRSHGSTPLHYATKWYHRHFSKIIGILACTILSLIIVSIALLNTLENGKTITHSPNDEHSNINTAPIFIESISDSKFRKNEQTLNLTKIENLIASTPDIVYYFEEGIRKMSDHRTITCVVLSRFQIFANTSSMMTHRDTFCLEENDEFGAETPAMIANDQYLIVCFDLIHRDSDYCVFAQFEDSIGCITQDKIEMILDINSNSELFDGITFSAHTLKSFALFGSQLFGVDISNQSLYHWSLSKFTAHKNVNFSFEQIGMSTQISNDLNVRDSMYPVRLEVHNGFLYLFQRFEERKGVEVSKISYFNNQIRETGIGWLYDMGHETLFDDFNKIHGFVFDSDFKKYFLFSDCEMIIENNTAANTADFYVDSDFKFQFENDGNWHSFYHIKIPISNHNFVFDEKNAFLDIEMNANNQWILQLDYTNNFVYFPIQFREFYDSIYFMQLKEVNLNAQSISVEFHPLMVKSESFSAVMTGLSILQTVASTDIAIQHMLDEQKRTPMIKNESELTEIVHKYGKHKWANAFYKILQTDHITDN